MIALRARAPRRIAHGSTAKQMQEDAMDV